MEKRPGNKKREVRRAFSVLIAAMLAVTLFAAAMTGNSDNDHNDDHDHSGCCENASVGSGGSGWDPSDIKMIAGGADHTLLLKNDGTVWAWGTNGNGQLGDGTNADKNIPVQVKGTGGAEFLTGVTAIDAGNSHSLALKSDGTVWAWGSGGNGQTGDGTNTDRNIPVQVKGTGGSGHLANVKEIAAGGYHSVALKNDGTVWIWGRNAEGQLGDGTETNRNTPVQVKSADGSDHIAGVKDIAAGQYHTLALTNDGEVWAWGYNTSGQLGDGTNTNKNMPVQVKGTGSEEHLTDVKEIAAGRDFSLVLKNGGTVWTWGKNNYGQLGDGTNADKNIPVQVKGAGSEEHLTDVKAIDAGGYHSVALKNGGTVWTWGSSSNGQLGDGTNTNKNIPVQVKGTGGAGSLTDVKGIAAGNNHSLAVKGDGTLWAWGSNNNGQLGDGTGTGKNTPVHIHIYGTAVLYGEAGHGQGCSCGVIGNMKDHTFGTVWSMNGTEHWHECVCGTKADAEEHTFGDWMIDTEADHLTDGSRHRICEECGYTETEAIHAEGHSFVIDHDGSGHWYVCRCSVRTDTEEHTFGNWMIDTEADHLTDGSRHRTCEECGYAETEAIHAEGHSFTIGYNGTEHWYECGCGTKADAEEHTFGDWMIDTEADHLTDGSRHRVCTECSYTETQTIYAEGHSFAMRYNGTEHWYECGCGIEKDRREHTFGNWTIDTEADHTTDGSKHRTCTECGYTETQTVYADDHMFGDWIIDREADHSTDGSKHRVCAECGHTETQTIYAEGHTFDRPRHNDSEHWYECGCGVTGNTEEHTFGTKWSIDGSEHWHACRCGARENASDHVFSDWIVDSPVSHTSDGYRHRTCDECGYIQRGILPVDHSFGDWTTGQEADHLTDGYRYRICAECGHTETQTIYAEGHLFSDWAVDHEADHLTDGSRHRTCAECGHTETQTIYAEGHTFDVPKHNDSEHWYECKCGVRDKAEEHVFGKDGCVCGAVGGSGNGSEGDNTGSGSGNGNGNSSGPGDNGSAGGNGPGDGTGPAGDNSPAEYALILIAGVLLAVASVLLIANKKA